MRFMESGGIYGRARNYPHTGGRVKRIFRTAIHIRFPERGPDFTRRSLNAQAFNAQVMHVLFVYEMRPTRGRRPPGTRKALPTPVQIPKRVDAYTVARKLAA